VPSLKLVTGPMGAGGASGTAANSCAGAGPGAVEVEFLPLLAMPMINSRAKTASTTGSRFVGTLFTGGVGGGGRYPGGG
jgi:hypothetical protein